MAKKKSKPNKLGKVKKCLPDFKISAQVDLLTELENRAVVEIQKVEDIHAMAVFNGAATEQVHHPAHYGGDDNPYETIKVIEANGFGFNLGNSYKYMARAGKKNPAKTLEDLQKSKWYLDRAIQNFQKAGKLT